MRFYAVHKTIEAGTSAGREFFTAKREAEKVAREWIKENPEERADVEIIEIKPTRRGILSALNIHAGYPDNG